MIVSGDLLNILLFFALVGAGTVLIMALSVGAIVWRVIGRAVTYFPTRGDP